MDVELEQQLADDYPILYDHYRTPVDEQDGMPPSIATFGFECGDGWYELIDMLSQVIESMVNEHESRQTVRAVQVKQKFGGLRFYTDPTPELAYGAVQMASRISRHTCESCGAYIDDVSETSGRLAALCADCEPPTNY